MSWLSPARWLIVGGLIAALVLGYFAWADHIGDQREATVRAEYTAAALVASEAARTKESAWQTQLTKAQDDATKRQIKLAADAAAARHSADSLRDDLRAVRGKLSEAARPALIEYASAGTELLAECSRSYTDLAEKADGHSADALMLLEAWPK